jgi:hypothetical protein
MYRSVGTAIVCSLLLVGQGSAQGRPIELGIDLGIEFGIHDAEFVDETIHTTRIWIPLAYFRVAFYESDQVWIEPRMTLLFLNAEGASSTVLKFVVGFGLDFQADATRARPYIHHFGGFLNVDSSEGDGATQMLLGGGLGVKVPMAERLASRLEGGVSYSFESDGLASGFGIYLTFGFSFFTRLKRSCATGGRATRFGSRFL